MSPRVSDATGRIQLRRRRRTRRIVLRVVAGVLVVALAALGTWVVGYSDLMTVRTVNVVGTGVLTPDQVRITAEAPLGTPMVWVDTSAIAARVAQMPPVQQVTVRRDWPTTLTIVVVERTAALVIPDGTVYTVVDASGVAFRTAAEVPPGVPVVNANVADQRVLRDVAAVWAALPQAYRDAVASIAATGPDEIVLTLTSGVTVVWGSNADNALKVTVSQALMKTDATTIDVSSPTNPTTR